MKQFIATILILYVLNISCSEKHYKDATVAGRSNAQFYFEQRFQN